MDVLDLGIARGRPSALISSAWVVSKSVPPTGTYLKGHPVVGWGYEDAEPRYSS